MLKFDEICGHEKVKEHMINAVKQKKPSHAYIITGPKLSGKKTIATTFAAALQCEAPDGTGKPCMECRSCRKLLSGNHPDVFFVEKRNTAVSIDDIRLQIKDSIFIKPYESPFKIYIISEAEKMRSEAQNALLKTLEEPPEYAVIILLCSSKEMMLDTILSRCVNLELRPVESTKIKKYLMEEQHLVDYQSDICVAHAQGNVGKAIKLGNSPEFVEFQRNTLDQLAHIKDMESHELVEFAKRIAAQTAKSTKKQSKTDEDGDEKEEISVVSANSENKLEIDDYFDIMVLWYHEVLMIKASNDINTLVLKDRYYELKKVAGEVTFQGIQNVLEAIEKSRTRIRANVNIEIVMDLLLFTMKNEAS